jgi:hypothetical protein
MRFPDAPHPPGTYVARYVHIGRVYWILELGCHPLAYVGSSTKPQLDASTTVMAYTLESLESFVDDDGAIRLCGRENGVTTVVYEEPPIRADWETAGPWVTAVSVIDDDSPVSMFVAGIARGLSTVTVPARTEANIELRLDDGVATVTAVDRPDEPGEFVIPSAGPKAAAPAGLSAAARTALMTGAAEAGIEEEGERLVSEERSAEEEAEEEHIQQIEEDIDIFNAPAFVEWDPPVGSRILRVGALAALGEKSPLVESPLVVVQVARTSGIVLAALDSYAVVYRQPLQSLPWYTISGPTLTIQQYTTAGTGASLGALAPGNYSEWRPGLQTEQTDLVVAHRNTVGMLAELTSLLDLASAMDTKPDLQKAIERYAAASLGALDSINTTGVRVYATLADAFEYTAQGYVIPIPGYTKIGVLEDPLPVDNSGYVFGGVRMAYTSQHYPGPVGTIIPRYRFYAGDRRGTLILHETYDRSTGAEFVREIARVAAGSSSKIGTDKMGKDSYRVACAATAYGWRLTGGGDPVLPGLQPRDERSYLPFGEDDYAVVIDEPAGSSLVTRQWRMPVPKTVKLLGSFFREKMLLVASVRTPEPTRRDSRRAVDLYLVSAVGDIVFSERMAESAVMGVPAYHVRNTAGDYAARDVELTDKLKSATGDSATLWAHRRAALGLNMAVEPYVDDIQRAEGTVSGLGPDLMRCARILAPGYVASAQAYEFMLTEVRRSLAVNGRYAAWRCLLLIVGADRQGWRRKLRVTGPAAGTFDADVARMTEWIGRLDAHEVDVDQPTIDMLRVALDHISKDVEH